VYGIVHGDLLQVQKGTPFTGLEPTGEVLTLEGRAVLAPVEPSKIVVVGRNYPRPGEAPGPAGEPLILLKPATTVIGAGAPIMCPPEVTRLKEEAELAVVIGRQAYRVPEEEAMAFVFGYTAANDLGAVDMMEKDGQWVRGKSYDTFCPLGPALVVGLDPSDLLITCRVNGREVQRASTAEMFHSVARLVAYASRVMTLLPGDTIVTGTPPGAVEVRPGDVVEVEIEGIGVLANPVASG
jgi:2-keto-4-pentenoate hydratase/2-oxohepta-3-ene-1,7-dioic acid hydratase in catechol pathway